MLKAKKPNNNGKWGEDKIEVGSCDMAISLKFLTFNILINLFGYLLRYLVQFIFHIFLEIKRLTHIEVNVLSFCAPKTHSVIRFEKNDLWNGFNYFLLF